MEGCLRTMTGVSQCWFSGYFRQVFFNTNELPRINIGADVWDESSIMTGVYERWCSSTLHIRWGLCDRLCLVLVCRGRYGLKPYGWGGSGPRAARTILLFHIISARPSKQPLMVRTFLKVHTLPRLAYALLCRGY